MVLLLLVQFLVIFSQIWVFFNSLLMGRCLIVALIWDKL